MDVDTPADLPVSTPRQVDVVVVGAGPAGLGAAFECTDRGLSVLVVETATEPGGLARSFRRWGWTLDLGSHVLDDGVEGLDDLWELVLDPDCHLVPLRRKPFYAETVASPIRSAWVICCRQLGDEAICSRLPSMPDASNSHWVVAPPRNAHQVIAGLYGESFYTMFFETYVRKYQGRTGDDVDPSFAFDLIGGRGTRRTAALRRPAPSTRAHRGSFRYPIGGMGSLIGNIADLLRSRGVDFALGQTVRTIHPIGHRQAVTTDRDVVEASHVISSIPWPVLSNVLGNAAESTGNVGPRCSVLVYLLVEGTEGFDELWRYVADDGVALGRVANVRRWWPDTALRASLRPGTVLICEYWCDSDDEIWTVEDATLTAQAIDDLDAVGIERGRVSDSHVVRVPNSHGVAYLGVQDDLRRLHASVAERGITMVGRSDGPGRGDVAGSLASGRRAVALIDRKECAG